MLNEYLEFKEYTSLLLPANIDLNNVKPKDNLYGRLQLKSLTERDGLKRILTTICRRFIHHDLMDLTKIVTITPENVVERTNLGLKALIDYTSYNVVDSPLDSCLVHERGCGKYFGYLLDIKEIYLKLHEIYENSKIYTSYRKIFQDLAKAEGIWTTSYVTERLAKNFYGRGNGLDSKYENSIISFDLIVADALHLGPLNHYNVLFPISIIEKLSDVAFPKYTIALTDFLFTAALYVILKNQNSNDYQLISHPDMINWCRNSGYYKNYRKFKGILQKLELFDEDFISNNAKKVIISDELLAGFKLINVLEQTEVGNNDEFITISDDLIYDEIEKVVKQKHEMYRKLKSKSTKKKSKSSL